MRFFPEPPPAPAISRSRASLEPETASPLPGADAPPAPGACSRPHGPLTLISSRPRHFGLAESAQPTTPPSPPASPASPAAYKSSPDGPEAPTPAHDAQGDPALAIVEAIETKPACLPDRGETLNPSHAARANRRADMLKAARQLRAEGLNNLQISTHVGASNASLWRWQKLETAGGFDALLGNHQNSGRKPPYLPSPAELACVREILPRLDESQVRGRGRGAGLVAAFRIAARSGDPRITPHFQLFITSRRKKTVPPSWLRLLQTPASVLARARDPRSTAAAYVTTPRARTIVRQDGVEVAMTCGAIMESDDGTLNFYSTIPWPFGGDPCSEKFGVKLARWQLLAAIDVHSEFCPAFDVVCREKSSYRAEDAGCLLGRAMIDICRPELWRLERGSWESRFVRDLLKLAGVPVVNAWHSKQKSAIERFFDRLWTPASLIPGHVGRDRGRFRPVEQLALACQQGRRDPRPHFLPLSEALKKLAACVEFANTEPIESRAWGTWIPQERWQTQSPGLPKLDESNRVFFSREQRVWTVRGACVGGPVEGPLVKFPAYFQTEALWEFEGCKVRCYFDPYADPVAATMVLEDETWRNFRRGQIIARDVPALELPPQAILCADWPEEKERSKNLLVRKAIAKAVRVEMWNWLGHRATEARDGLGGKAVRDFQPAISQPPIRNSTPPTESRLIEEIFG